MKTDTHKICILKRLYDSAGKFTATDFSYISNPNQFFVDLENDGLIKSEWGKKGKAKVKLRFVPYEMRDKVLEYLSKHIKSYEVDREN